MLINYTTQISSGRNDDATIQQIIEIECERLEKQILVRYYMMKMCPIQFT